MPTLSTSSVNMDSMEDQLHYDRRPCRWRLQTCCFFVSLRSGCYGISILSMVEALLYMSLASSVLFLHNTTKCNNTDEAQCRPKFLKGGLDHENLLSNYVIGAVVLVLLIMCVYFLVSALLFYGIMKRRPKLLSPWLWWSIGEMLATFHSFSLVERSFSLLLKVYCCFIVCSYIEKLKEQQREEEIVTYVSVRNSRPGGGGTVLGGGPVFLGPVGNDIGGSSSPNPYVPTHVFMPTATSQDEFLVKMESVNASRMYGGQRPPPYSPPLAGFVATTSSGAAATLPAGAAAEEGALVDTVDVVTTDPTSIMASVTDSSLAVMTDAAAVAAVSGINSNNSMLPLLPPSYEEAISVAVVSEYTRTPQILTPLLSPVPGEEQMPPPTDTNTTLTPIPGSLQQPQQQQQSSEASVLPCQVANVTAPVTKPIESSE